ncbi:MAG: formimidoylglutamate deiminase [Frondihabitans sp.]|nr:formimidoylglutamate deiminase [Frondihabitans sp.]
MTSFWFERAVVGDTVRNGVLLEEEGGRILRLTPDLTPPPGIAAFRGVALPGLATAHSHAFHRALRGRTHGDGGTFWSWRERMYRAAAALSPESYYELARGVFAEMLLAGYTAVGEFHYVHHRPDGSAYAPATAMAEAIGAAAADAGIRLTLLDTLYRFGGVDVRGGGGAGVAGGVANSGELLPLAPEQVRFGDASATDFLNRHALLTETPLRRVGLAAHSLRAVTVADVVALRSAFPDQVLHAHVSEQPAENEQVDALLGLTPVGALAEAGVLGPGFTGVHLTHLADADIALLADADAIACFCPTTERDLADGIGPARALADAGVRIALGSDQNAVVDPFEEIRGLEMDDRLASGRRGRFTPQKLVESASVNGYASLGWPEGGRLVGGSLCDFVVVDDRSPRTAGADAAQLWLAATGADVTDVVVGGSQVVRGRRHAFGDVGALLFDSITALEMP